MARLFNGTTQALSVPLDLSPYNKVTFSCWLWWDVFTAGNNKLAFEYTSSFIGKNGCVLNPNATTNIQISISNATSYNQGNFPRPSAAAWHHYVACYDRTTGTAQGCSAYVDGVAVTVTDVTLTDLASSNYDNSTLYVMSRSNTSLFGAGRMAELAVWAGVILTAAEAKALGSGITPPQVRPGSLFAYLPLIGADATEYELVGKRAVALTAAPTRTDHPRIIRPHRSVLVRGLLGLTLEQGSFALTGQSTNLLKKSDVPAAQGSFALTGQAAVLRRDLRLTAAQGSFALTGQAATFGVSLPATQGSFALSGQAATLTRAARLTAAQGSFALTGQAATFGVSLPAAQGSFALSGQAAVLRRDLRLTAAQGSFALSGQAVAFPRSYVVAAEQGSFALTGQPDTFAVSLPVAQGSFALSGQAVAFRHNYVVAAEQGSFALTGQSANLILPTRVIANAGSFACAGQSAGLRHGVFIGASYSVAAGAGSFALTGQAATLTKLASTTPAVTAQAGLFALSGSAAGLTKGSAGARVLTANVGLFTLTGQAAQLTSTATSTPLQRGGRRVPRKRYPKLEPIEYQYEGSGGFSFGGAALVRFEAVAVRRIYGGRGALAVCSGCAEISFRAMPVPRVYRAQGGLRRFSGAFDTGVELGSRVYVVTSGRGAPASPEGAGAVTFERAAGKLRIAS